MHLVQYVMSNHRNYSRRVEGDWRLLLFMLLPYLHVPRDIYLNFSIEMLVASVARRHSPLGESENAVSVSMFYISQIVVVYFYCRRAMDETPVNSICFRNYCTGRDKSCPAELFLADLITDEPPHGQLPITYNSDLSRLFSRYRDGPVSNLHLAMAKLLIIISAFDPKLLAIIVNIIL